MRIKEAVVVFKTDKRVEEDSSKLRGYFGKKFPDEILLHHHVGKETIYAYPRVQYKVIEGTPIIVGIEEGAEVLQKICSEIDEIVMGKRKYRVKSVHINISEVEFGKCKQSRGYKILLPWLALNQENYRRYKEMEYPKEKKKMLNGVLVANVLSMCKSLGYTVKGRLFASSRLNKTTVKFKGVYVIGFTGEFRINFILPDYIGIGKGVSHGFGTVKSLCKKRRESL